MLCDVAKAADVQAVVDKTIARLGKVDILVNNAGVTWAAEPEDMPLDKWQKVVDINLTGAFLFAQAAGRDMLKRQWGRIINVASIAGLHASVAGTALRGVRGDARPGLMGLTRELAASWGAQGHPRQRDRAGLLPLAAGRRRDRDDRGGDQGDEPDSARRRRPASSRASRCSSPPTRPTTSPARRSSSTAGAQSRERPTSPYAARPWLQHYDYWVRSAPDLSRPAAGRHPRRSRAIERPDRPATQFLGAELTFLELKQRADALAAALARLGIVKGDRVGIMLPNCPQYIIAAFAILRLGAIVVNINPSYTAREVLTVAADSGMRIVDHARRAGAARAWRPRPDVDRADHRHLAGRVFGRRGPAAAGRRRADAREPDHAGRSRPNCRASTIDVRTTSPSSNTPAARPARRRARC